MELPLLRRAGNRRVSRISLADTNKSSCWHVVENAGPDKLYCLTVMVPNEGFTELVRKGETMALDGADRATITGWIPPRCLYCTVRSDAA